eukprot:6237772-Alexandrium_andersonii.AAC.1
MPTGSNCAPACKELRHPSRPPSVACHPPSSTRLSLKERTSWPLTKQTELSRLVTRATPESDEEGEPAPAAGGPQASRTAGLPEIPLPIDNTASLDLSASAPAAAALRHRAHSAKRYVLRPHAQTPSCARTSRGRVATASFQSTDSHASAFSAPAASSSSLTC